MARVHTSTLKELLQRILTTHKEEIGCESCYESLDRFVELELDGKNAEQALPLIKRHLELCSGCGEEYQALLAAVESLQADQTAD
ncbi:MAG: hypothetical protein KF821_04360 [Anaerolineales bacterium]|jgi:hypothetical protein|nr:hypothetical protein [Anaerolineales bacterium]